MTTLVPSYGLHLEGHVGESSLVCTLTRRGIESLYRVGMGGDAEASHPCLIMGPITQPWGGGN